MRFTQEQYVAVATFFLANPTLGFPVSPEYTQGEFDHTLDARNWLDKVEKGIEKALPIATKVASEALPIAASILKREELAELAARHTDGDWDELTARDLDDSNELSARDLDNLTELAARDPSFGSFLKKASKGAIRAGKKAAPYVGPVLGALVARDEAHDHEELSARDLDELARIAARDPSFGSFLKKAGKGAIRAGKKAAPYVGPVLSALVARDEPIDYNELSTRDIDELAELAARDPSWGGFWKGVKNVGKEAVHVTHEAAPVVKEAVHLGQKVAPVVGPMLSKLAARDPKGWNNFVRGVENVDKEAIHAGQEVAPVAK